MRVRSSAASVALYGLGVLYGLAVLAPLAWIVLLSLKTRLDAFAYPPLLTFSPTLDNYREVFADPLFLRAATNSLIVSISSVLIALLFAVPATFGLRNLTGRIKQHVLLTILLIRIVPGMVYLLPYFVVYTQLDLLDTYFGLILVYLIFNIPLVIWMLLPVWNSLPSDLREAAALDGATPIQTMLRVELPLIRNGVIAASILAFIFSWNEFLFALVFTRREVVTLPVAIINYLAFEGTQWGKISAAAIVILLPVVVFGYLVQRKMISGLSAGSVKA